MRQFWQKWKAELGTTHPSRAPEKIAAKKRTRSDGRPPDTARQLLGKHLIDGDDVLDTSSPTKQPAYMTLNELRTSGQITHAGSILHLSSFSSQYHEISRHHSAPGF